MPESAPTRDPMKRHWDRVRGLTQSYGQPGGTAICFHGCQLMHCGNCASEIDDSYLGTQQEGRDLHA